MFKKQALLLFAISFFSVSNLCSQDLWKKTDSGDLLSKNSNSLFIKNFPKKYSLMNLELNEFKSSLNKISSRSNKQENIIKLPNSKGELKKFSIEETSYLAPELATKFPMIKSYSAQGIDDPTAVAKISIGTDGLHAVIFSGKENTIYVDPYTKNKEVYIVYKRADLKSNKSDFECQVEASAKKIVKSTSFQRNAGDGKLRTYRIAIASTGEYSQFHINRTTPTPNTDSEKKAAVISAINTTLTRINGVFERDLSVTMVLVNDNDKIVFLDPNTDELSNDSPDNLIEESQQKCDDVIGDANYDIGHTFSTGGGGLAQLNSVCVKDSKAKGITGRGQPINDPFDIDYVAHEIGHQFGATHTFNGDTGNCSGNRSNATAVEPGSGSTIMGYAGICSPQNVQDNSDDYFSAVSIAQMWTHIQGNGSCGALTDTNNDPPTANAGADMNIPKSTPFLLKGSATDPQGTSSLTYNWEQVDSEIASMPPVSTNNVGPMFRSLPSKASPNRYMPELATIISGNTSTTWEVLPSVARELNFAFTVRDNHSSGGSTARDDMKVTVIDTDPFVVNTPNSAVTWTAGATETITWNKGTTDQAPINCSKVNIRLSTDGGLTFPILMKENIDNDGTEEIIIPNNPTSQARIMVEAVDNIFYNVNSSNFTINSSVPTFLIKNETSEQTVCNTGGNSVDYTLNFDFINGFSETVTLSATGLPNGANAVFNPATINTNGTVIMTINNLDGSNQQDYTIVVEGQSATVTQTVDAFLKVLGSSFSNITLTSPTNAANNVNISPEFTWGEDSNATSYNIVVSTDTNFSNITINETVTTNSFSPSSPLTETTKYYWYVKPINDCGEGANSSVGEFTTEAPSYCDSRFTDEPGGTEHITNVTFSNINNNSGNDTVDGYQDFTAITGIVEPNKTYQISVTFDTGGYQDHCYVFIDWNKDYQFDNASERYDLGNHTDEDGDPSTTNTSTSTLDITVPNNAAIGELRMRVIIEYYENSSPNGEGACDTDHKSEWGETEDYTITIDDGLLANDNNLFKDLKAYPIPNDGKITVSFRVKDTAMTTLRLFDLRGRLVDTQNFVSTPSLFNREIQFLDVNTGIYLLQIENAGETKMRKIIIR